MLATISIPIAAGILGVIIGATGTVIAWFTYRRARAAALAEEQRELERARTQYQWTARGDWYFASNDSAAAWGIEVQNTGWGEIEITGVEFREHGPKPHGFPFGFPEIDAGGGFPEIDAGVRLGFDAADPPRAQDFPFDIKPERRVVLFFDAARVADVKAQYVIVHGTRESRGMYIEPWTPRTVKALLTSIRQRRAGSS